MIGLVVIGDEILSSQIQEKNLKYMLHNFAISGYKVSEARIIGDDFDLISSTIKELSEKYEFVVTSGGVGPTHDDITIEAISSAFSVSLYLNETLNGLLKQYFKEKMTTDILRMAHLPLGADVIMKEEYEWPVIKMKNCFILPGVPKIFTKKFDHVLQLLPQVEKYFYASIYVSVDETELSESLRELDTAFASISIGSYPILDEPNYKTQFTLKSKDKGVLAKCFDELKALTHDKKWFVKAVEPSFYAPSSKE